VSPANVFLGRNGDVKLGDFGVAKMSRASVQTVPGTIKGKIAYMSPEQAAAFDVDARSDLFSAGVVLFEVLTGQRPFTATSDLELLRMLIEGEAPDPLSLAPRLPPALAAFLRKSLANDRLDRFQSAEEMSRALLACAEGPAVGPGDVARLVAAHARPEDAVPAADPFAVALGLNANADADADADEGSSKTATHEKDTVPSRPRPPPQQSPRWPLAAVLLVVVAGVVGGSFALKPPAPLETKETPPPVTSNSPVPVVLPAVVTPEAEVDAGALADAGPLDPPKRSPRASKGKATLDVNSTPWAKVYLDGAFVGETAVTGLVVAAGKHRLRLHNPTVDKSWETSLELIAGEHRVIPVDLEAKGVASKP
jgi:serine/threonine protein kinase